MEGGEMNADSEAVYFGKGYSGLYDDYMDFINYVFGFNGANEDFKKLLPKLYRPEDDPCGSSYIALENGKLKAAVGAYSLDVCVAGEVLHTRGIGNVAVHPYYRSKGYMRKLMELAVDDMVRDGIDFSALGGKRQRYNYFYFEKCGECVSLSLNTDNMRHALKGALIQNIDIKKIGSDDEAALDAIAELVRSQPFYALRKRERLYDILTSWGASVWYAGVNESFIGYALVKGDEVSELLLTDEARLAEFCAALLSASGRSSLSVKLPSFMSGYIDRLCRIAENCSAFAPESFAVFNFERTLRAFFKLKAQTCRTVLPDGELTLLIHGRAGDENLSMRVSGGVPTVERSAGTYALELDGLEAMNLLFAPVYPKRNELTDFARLWLPLPIYLFPADTV